MDHPGGASLITIRGNAEQSAMTIRPARDSRSRSKEDSTTRQQQRRQLDPLHFQSANCNPYPIAPSPRLFDFGTVSHLLIPPPTQCGRLIICSAPAQSSPDPNTQQDGDRGRRKTRNKSGDPPSARTSTQSSSRSSPPTEYKIVSHPMALQHEKYERMNLVYNLCFVFEAGSSTTAYEGVVRKCARALRDLELTAGFLSQPHNLRRVHNVCEQLYEDLNSYCESFVAIPDQPHTNFYLWTDSTTPRLAVQGAPEVAERAMNRHHPSPKRKNFFISPDWEAANAGEEELEGKVLSGLDDTERHKLEEQLATLDKAAHAALAGEEVKSNNNLTQIDRKGRPLPVDTKELLPTRREPPHGLGRTVQEAINVKLFPTYPNPPEAHDWDVPVALLNLTERITGDWDLTMTKVVPFIDGVRHVRRIAQLADADLDLTRQCMEHLLFYGCIVMTDIFQHSNIYTVRPTLARDGDNDDLFAECSQYVTRLSCPLVAHAKLLELFAAFTPTKTVGQWCDEQHIDEWGVDPRRFVSFGTLKGLLRRMHRIPVLALPDLALNTSLGAIPETSRSRSGARVRRTVYDADMDMPSPEQARSIPAPLVSPQARPWWGSSSSSTGNDNNHVGPASERGRAQRGRTGGRDLQLIREESWAPSSPSGAASHNSQDHAGHHHHPHRRHHHHPPPPPHRTRSDRRRAMASTATDPASLAYQSSLQAQKQSQEGSTHGGSPVRDSPTPQGSSQHIPASQRTRASTSGFGPGSRPSFPSTATHTPSAFGPPSSPPRYNAIGLDVSDTPNRKGKSLSSFGPFNARLDPRYGSIPMSTPGGLPARQAGWSRYSPVPSDLLQFLDGTQIDDAICAYFAVSWADVERWIEMINMDASRIPDLNKVVDSKMNEPGPDVPDNGCSALMSAFNLPDQSNVSLAPGLTEPSREQEAHLSRSNERRGPNSRCEEKHSNAQIGSMSSTGVSRPMDSGPATPRSAAVKIIIM